MARMIVAILLAAGESKRFGKQDKLLLPLLGKPVFQWSVETFKHHPIIHKFLVVVSRKNISKIKKNFKKLRFALGGKTRQDSVFNAVHEFARRGKKRPEFLLIHNAANPFVTEDEIFRCLYFLQKHRTIDGVGVGRPVNDTVKLAVPNGREAFIQKTLDRNFLWQMETPQVVRFQPFFEAHQKARKEKFEATDDLTLLEWYGRKTAVIEASPLNFKITTPRDYELAKILVGDLPKNVRVGVAEDTHLFSRTHRGLRLGGLLFPKLPLLEADSDGDVVLHALATAISQALSGSSLGTFATPLFKRGVRDSTKYLQKILNELEKQKFFLQHVGIHIQGREPKIDPLSEKLKSSLSTLLKISKEKIGITAETGDGKFDDALRCVASVTLVSLA